MGTGDGTVLGIQDVWRSGPNNARFNIVIVGEGFTGATIAAQTDFAARCNDILARIQTEPWLRYMLDAINLHALFVRSDDAGADDPMTCADMSTGSGASPDTFFDAMYCSGGVRRCLAGNWTLMRDTINAQMGTAPWHAGVLLVNSTQRGGCANRPLRVFATALSTDWLNVVMHELGHAGFGLADEYSTWRGCASGETDHNNAPAGEPSSPNITSVSTLAGLKWAHLVGPTTPVPTMENPDCTQCDMRANVRADDLEIGLFEGAGYYHCDYYRPAYACRMRDSTRFFCRVCVESVHARLRTFFGARPTLSVSVAEIDFGSIGRGSAVTRTFELSNVGTVPVTGIAIAAFSDAMFTASLPTGVTSLAVGASATVTARFGPGMITGSRSSTLRITSNAPDVSFPVRGVICAPQPRAQVAIGSGGTLLDFGNVVRRRTMYRWFEVRNLMSPCPADLAVTLTSLTTPWSYPGTPTTFTVPAPTGTQTRTSRRVYVAFTAPTTGSVFAASLTVSTPGDPTSSPVTITLRARAVDPVPVDTVLVIDRSGSMSEPTGVPGVDKMAMAIQASRLYISLLKANDRIGAVRFNHAAANPGDILQAMVVAGPGATGAGRVATNAALTPTALAPSGATSIGAGTILGSTVLDTAVAASRAILVLTDGRENFSPTIADATAVVAPKTPRQRVFAVGLGLNQLEDRLVAIASVTNGVAQITGDLVGDREFLLQKLYVQILSDVSDQAFVRDPVNVLYPGTAQPSDVFIGEVDVSADFIVVYRPGSMAGHRLGLWLEAPDGRRIEPSDAGTTYPSVEFVAGPGHAFFRCEFPFDPSVPGSHVGRWRVWLESQSRTGATHGYRDYNAGYAGSNDPGFYYSVMAKASSDLLLPGRLVQLDYAPGSTMTIVLEPTLFGVPAVLDEPVEVRVTRPDGSVRWVQLTAGPDGDYRGDFTDTDLLGVYQISAEVWATTPSGVRVTRYRQLTGLIFERRPPGDDGGPHDGDGKPCLDCDQLRKLHERVREVAAYVCDLDRDGPACHEARALFDEIQDAIKRCCG